MTLEQLRYFVAAAKYEHIHKAAQSIPISASVVSQAVRQLESELACELFIRERKKLRLSPQGRKLLEMSGTVLGQVESIRETLGQADQALEGHYRIGGSHFLAAKLLTPIWTKLQTKFPKLTVEMHSQPTWALVDSLLAGRLDFAIGFSPAAHPQLEMEEVFRGYSEIVLRKNHPILRRDKKERHKWLAEYPVTMHMATEKIFSARNYPAFKKLNSSISFSFDSDFTALENLKNSNSWAYMIDIVAMQFNEELVVVETPYRSETQYTVQIMRHKSRKIDSAMSAVFEQIKAHFAQRK